MFLEESIDRVGRLHLNHVTGATDQVGPGLASQRGGMFRWNDFVVLSPNDHCGDSDAAQGVAQLRLLAPVRE